MPRSTLGPPSEPTDPCTHTRPGGPGSRQWSQNRGAARPAASGVNGLGAAVSHTKLQPAELGETGIQCPTEGVCQVPPATSTLIPSGQAAPWAEEPCLAQGLSTESESGQEDHQSQIRFILSGLGQTHPM